MKMNRLILSIVFLSSVAFGTNDGGCGKVVLSFGPLVSLVRQSLENRNPTDALLEQLSADTAEGRLLVALFGEVVPFPPDQREALVNALFLYAEANQDSVDEDTRVAVGSAIRKLAMNMSESDFDRFATLLPESPDSGMPARNLSVLLSALEHRLMYVPFDPQFPTPVLNDRIAMLATSWQDALLDEDFRGSIAESSTLAALVLGADVDGAVAHANASNAQWVRDLVIDRVGEILSKEQPAPIVESRLKAARDQIRDSSPLK